MAELEQADIVGLVFYIKDLRAKVKIPNKKSRLLKLFVNYLRQKRRRNTVQVLHTLNEIICRRESVERRFWQEPSRGQCLFWERTVNMWNDDKLWLENFRMSRQSFSLLCNELRGVLQKHDTRFRKAITVEKRLAVCLWHLATGED